MTPSVRELHDLAQSGDPEAQYLLATEYIYGDRLEKSASRALYWYLESAKQGCTSAKWNAGTMLLDGEGSSTKDETLALTLVQSAADGGHHSAIDFLNYCFKVGRYGLNHNSLELDARDRGSRVKTDIVEPMSVPLILDTSRLNLREE